LKYLGMSAYPLYHDYVNEKIINETIYFDSVILTNHNFERRLLNLNPETKIEMIKPYKLELIRERQSIRHLKEIDKININKKVADIDSQIKTDKIAMVDKVKNAKMGTLVKDNIQIAKQLFIKLDERNELVDKVKLDFDIERNTIKADKTFNGLKHTLSPLKKWENKRREI